MNSWTEITLPLSLPFPFPSPSLLSICLEAAPSNSAKGSVERFSSPSGVRGWAAAANALWVNLEPRKRVYWQLITFIFCWTKCGNLSTGEWLAKMTGRCSLHACRPSLLGLILTTLPGANIHCLMLSAATEDKKVGMTVWESTNRWRCKSSLSFDVWIGMYNLGPGD